MNEKTARIHETIPPQLLAEIDARVDPRGRSTFIVQALKEKLARDERLKLFDEMTGALEDVDTPGWETPESASAWVRALREESDARVDELWAEAWHDNS